MTKVRARKKKRRMTKKLIIVGIAAAVLYLAGAIYFNYHFFYRTTLNGMNVSGLSVKSVREMITKEMDDYKLKIESIDGSSQIIRGSDISLKPEFEGQIKQLVGNQHSLLWLSGLFHKTELTGKTMVKYDSGALETVIQNLDCQKAENQKAPVDAYCTLTSGNKYEIVPEEQGSQIIPENLEIKVKSAIQDIADVLDLEKEDCYVKPQVTSKSVELNTLLKNLNHYVETSINYQLGEKTEVLDGSIINGWLKISGTSVTIDQAGIADYVAGLAKKYNTAFRKRQLKTTGGDVITVEGGDYGWKVDKDGEKKQILADLEKGGTINRDMLFSQTANSHGDNDYGDTYVEINLTKQHLYYYKNGKLVIQSDFVSGNISKNLGTPTGTYALTYKEKDATLKGEDYATPVTYWMPFCNNVGMHDAYWRNSFGGDIYLTNGSHGCINLPPSSAKAIFENIDKGAAVIVFYLPGTQPQPPAPVVDPAAAEAAAAAAAAAGGDPNAAAAATPDVTPVQ